ncbi:MAG: hypothetical protein ACR2PY_04380 [Salinispira sp.]
MLVDLLDKPWRAGLEQGLEQGQAQLQREHVLRMLRKGMSMDIIHDITKLSGDDIRAFQKNAQG